MNERDVTPLSHLGAIASIVGAFVGIIAILLFFAGESQRQKPSTQNTTGLDTSSEGNIQLPKFSIRLNFGDDLANKKISENLRKEFQNNGILLSPNAAVSITEDSRAWKITNQDNQQAFLIRRGETGKLDIYEVIETRGGIWGDDRDINEPAITPTVYLILLILTALGIGSVLYFMFIFRNEHKKLFSIGRGYQRTLNDTKISRGLRKEFENNGILLSLNAAVSIRQPDSQWLITDEGRKYTIQKTGNQLNIYKRED